MVWIEWIGAALVLCLVLVAALAAIGNMRWNGLTKSLVARLEATRTRPEPPRFDTSELQGLPAPVQRYFRAVLTDGSPIVAAATATHSGTFNIGATVDLWKPFTSTQRVVTRRNGFVWSGRVAVLPGLAVRVIDAYVGGEGILHPAMLGLFALGRLQGGGSVAQGELMRFFAEAAWYPTALLPSQGVRWQAVDDRCAAATLIDGPLALTLLFSFDDAGLIDTVRAEARGRMVGKAIVMAPWEGRWSNYERRNGMTVPLTGEAAWLLPEGRKPYWRGTIMSLTYESAS